MKAADYRAKRHLLAVSYAMQDQLIADYEALESFCEGLKGVNDKLRAPPPDDGALREALNRMLSSADFRSAFEDYLSLPPRAGDDKECRMQARELVEIVRVQVAALARTAQTQGERITMTEAIQSAKQTRIDAERRRREVNEREAAEYAPPAPDRADGKLISDAPTHRCEGCGETIQASPFCEYVVMESEWEET